MFVKFAPAIHGWDRPIHYAAYQAARWVLKEKSPSDYEYVYLGLDPQGYFVFESHGHYNAKAKQAYSLRRRIRRNSRFPLRWEIPRAKVVKQP